MKLSFCSSSFISAAICLILWIPALHYRNALTIMASVFIIFGLIAAFWEKPPPKL